jgi:predicted TIM-barrel fold metal-dependent hydrolase
LSRVDVHAHYFENDYLDLIDRLGGIEPTTEQGRRTMAPSRAADFEARFADMDRAGIDLEILSVSGIAPYFDDARKAVDGARFANDLYAQLVREHPRRFAAFATLPLPHIDAALAELGRGLDELGMVGASISTTVLGRSLGDPLFDPLYAELDRRHAVLFIHPAGMACGSSSIKKANLTWPLGAPFEDTLCALELMQAGFTTRFPNVRAIVPHLGGTLPFLSERLGQMSARFMAGKGNAAAMMRTFWYDTVNGNPNALRLARDAFGIDKLLFGTDYPFWKDDAHQLAMSYILDAGLPDDDVTAIFEGNARSIFGDRFPLLVKS